MAAFYWLCTYFVGVLFFLFSRRQVIGLENVPRKGPLIVVSNHLNNVDPGFVAITLRRRIAFMCKEELFHWPIMGPMFRWAGGFPVRRHEADLSALRTAVHILGNDIAVGMFPEGTRSRTGILGTAYPGTAIVAFRSGAPILPVAITGTQQIKGPLSLLRRPAMTIVIGKPFVLSGSKRIRTPEVVEGTETIMRHIGELLPPERRGAYGEKPTSVTQDTMSTLSSM